MHSCVVRDAGCVHRVDWWSFGILIYELLYGCTPFRGKKRDETFNNILKRPLSFPEQPEVSEQCKVGVPSSVAAIHCVAMAWSGPAQSAGTCQGDAIPILIPQHQNVFFHS